MHYSLVSQCNDRGYDVLLMDQIIDNHFIQHLEYKAELSFKRVDADTIDQLIEKDEKQESVLSQEEQDQLQSLFKSVSLNQDSQVEIKPLSPNDPPVQIIRPEFMRRMSEMQHMMHMMKGDQNDLFKDHYQLVINSNHATIAQKMIHADEGQKMEMATYLTELALLEQQMLKGPALNDFIKKSLSRV